MGELLDIVDRDDNVIGQIDRENKRYGHDIVRMVFVGFYTPERELILQRRSKLKKSSPGRLTSTVSGHVSSGQTYGEAAVRETLEETGVSLAAEQLVHLGTMLGGSAMRAVYAYPFDGTASDLTIEPDEGDGFVTMPVETLETDRHDHPRKYAPFLRMDAGSVLLDYIRHT